MQDVKLPDGTWVTTAMAVGIGGVAAQCLDDTCTWEDTGPPMSAEPAGDGEIGVPVQMQKCPKCGWVRGRYLGDPHPELKDEDNANDRRGDDRAAADDDHGSDPKGDKPTDYLLI